MFHKFTIILLVVYLTGVVAGIVTISVAQWYYKRKVKNDDVDWSWILKISLLSWMTVALAIMLLKETWHSKKSNANDQTSNKHNRKETTQ